jgi:hypothetical protein
MLAITKPAINSYLHYAQDLSIAQTDPRSKEYLALAFLQLHTKPDNTRRTLLVDFYAHNLDYPLCPFLENLWLTGSEIQKFGTTATEIACKLIDAQRYVRVDLNEFYVKHAASYQKPGSDLSLLPVQRRPLHFNLIYRYCASAQKFFTHGFNDQKHFTDRSIGFDEFEKAYYGHEVGMRAIRLRAPCPDDRPLYSIEAAVAYLTDFIESRSNFLTQKQLAPKERLMKKFGHRLNFLGYQPLGSTFGMATYDVAASMVERNNGRFIDVRPWCLFHDHKGSLLRLHDYLSNEKNMVFDSSVRKQLQLLENDFFSLRNHMVESRLSDRKVKPAILARNIEKLKAADRDAIAALISGIRHGANKGEHIKAA